jgi:L-lactate dehydrogenase complex protein LldF
VSGSLSESRRAAPTGPARENHTAARVDSANEWPGFPAAARAALADDRLRANLRNATQTIRAKRAGAVSELADWEALREAARLTKVDVLARLDSYLVQFEAAVTAAGGRVHWAVDAAQANAIVVDIARAHGAGGIVKMKSLTTDEIGLNEALAAAGIDALETDLAELILQLAGDTPSHILMPAIHRNRREVRDLFARTIAVGRDLSDDPGELAEAARLYLRERFLDARVGVSGANFGVAETGTICIVESEGNGRMCTTLPPVLVSILGIEKLVPSLDDLEVFLQLLPRSATGERMNPYTSLWTGVTAGDGPQELHVVLLDNGRSNVLRDEVGRQALQCIRCGACLNVCPVYTRVGGHAYGSVYPGPIGAILAPQLRGLEQFASLPFASSLCGACYEVCPVKIDIPSVLLHLRATAVQATASVSERATFRTIAWMFGSSRRFGLGQRLGRLAQRPLLRAGVIRRLPGLLGGWTRGRDLRPVARETFREWWSRERGV